MWPKTISVRAAGPETLSYFALFPPRRALHGAVRTLRGFDLAHRVLPVLLVPAVRFTLSLPKRIGAPRDMLVFPRIHGQSPTLPQVETNSANARRQIALACTGAGLSAARRRLGG